MADADATFHPYQVTSQERKTVFSSGGQFREVWRVGFEDKENGYHDYVEIPVAQYTPVNVDNAIQAELDSISGVHELGEEPHPENAAEGA
jgi:hypothetical protein